MDIIQPLDFCSLCCNVMVTAWKMGSKQEKTPLFSIWMWFCHYLWKWNGVKGILTWLRLCTNYCTNYLCAWVKLCLPFHHRVLWQEIRIVLIVLLFVVVAFDSSGRNWSYFTRRKGWKCWEISWIYLFK